MLKPFEKAGAAQFVALKARESGADEGARGGLNLFLASFGAGFLVFYGFIA